MQKKILLAPVICMIVMGFIGAPFSPLLARTTDKNAKPTDIARQHMESQISDQDQMGRDRSVMKASQKQTSNAKKGKKKTGISKKGARKKSLNKAVLNSRDKRSTKKTRSVKHGDSTPTYPSPGLTDFSPESACLSSLMPPQQQPSDLWLAKDNPAAYGLLKQEELNGDLDKLTLNILYSAYRCLGTPYRYGGTTPSGFDCSGFVQYVFGENGITLGRSSRDQAREGVPIQLSELKPGDLIFFNMRQKKHSSIDHVGLYIGNGQFIHASSYRSREITIENLENGSYMNRLVGARRILEYPSNESVVIE